MNKLLVFVILLVLIGAVVWIVTQKSVISPLPNAGSFQKDYTSLAQSWKSRGVQSDSLNGGFDALVALSPEKISDLHAELEAKKSASTADDSRALLEAYSSMASLAQHINKLRVMERQLNESDKSYCEDTALYTAYAQEVEKTALEFESFSQKSDYFVRTYGPQADSVGFYGIGRSAADFLENAKIIVRDIDAAKGLC